MTLNIYSQTKTRQRLLTRCKFEKRRRNVHRPSRRVETDRSSWLDLRILSVHAQRRAFSIT